MRWRKKLSTPALLLLVVCILAVLTATASSKSPGETDLDAQQVEAGDPSVVQEVAAPEVPTTAASVVSQTPTTVRTGVRPVTTTALKPMVTTMSPTTTSTVLPTTSTAKPVTTTTSAPQPRHLKACKHPIENFQKGSKPAGLEIELISDKAPDPDGIVRVNRGEKIANTLEVRNKADKPVTAQRPSSREYNLWATARPEGVIVWEESWGKGSSGQYGTTVLQPGESKSYPLEWDLVMCDADAGDTSKSYAPAGRYILQGLFVNYDGDFIEGPHPWTPAHWYSDNTVTFEVRP